MIREQGVLSGSSIFFHTPSQFAKSSLIHMVCAGEYFCDGNYRVNRESFPSFLLMLVKSGRGQVMVQGQTYQLEKNDVIIIDCYQPHAYSTDSGWETVWLHFNGKTAQNWYDHISQNAGIRFSINQTVTLPKYFALILDGLKRNEPLSEELTACHIQRILTEIIELSRQITQNTTKSQQIILEAVNFIEHHYQTALTVQHLADRFQVSLFHFSRIFRMETGYSPYEYIIKTRIDQAKLLLRQTHTSVKEITFLVGYHSESNFIKSFKDRVNLSPNSFRSALW